MTTKPAHHPEPADDPRPDMADVVEGPVGSASIVNPADVPDREGTMPELGLAGTVPPEPAPDVPSSQQRR